MLSDKLNWQFSVVYIDCTNYLLLEIVRYVVPYISTAEYCSLLTICRLPFIIVIMCASYFDGLCVYIHYLHVKMMVLYEDASNL